MASSALRTTAFLLTLNLLFFTLVSSQTTLPAASGTCDGLKFGVCAGFFNLVGGSVGTAPSTPCCSLFFGLVDLEAATCLCTAIKANVLGVALDVPATFSLVVNNCGTEVPADAFITWVPFISFPSLSLSSVDKPYSAYFSGGLPPPPPQRHLPPPQTTPSTTTTAGAFHHYHHHHNLRLPPPDLLRLPSTITTRSAPPHSFSIRASDNDGFVGRKCTNHHLYLQTTTTTATR
ncbi:hypothetical protein OSB04_009828 [Centaurea solstitialis]|uniref:Hydrophobic seed protein domain-containing protein n=1 Tax=Centaurea solstitialis TaxID=347529 RepID=A0AA38WMI2_9ASTR|nr:hypothetical protein OSB04_009828 [Centaurea solstitialis]